MLNFTENYQQALKMKAQDSKNGSLETLRVEANSSISGIGALLRTFNSSLIGSPGITDGLLELIIKDLNKSLCDSNKHEKNIYWYLKTIDLFMGEQIYRQQGGLALRIFAENAGKQFQPISFICNISTDNHYRQRAG